MRALRYAVFVVAMMPAVSSFAQETLREPIVPDRPDFTDGTLVVPRGTVQVEAGATMTGAGSATELAIGEVLVRVPMTDAMELRLFAPSYVRTRDDGSHDAGFSDTALGVKLRMREGLALLVTTSVGHRPEPEAKLALERDVTESVSLATNIGYARPAGDGSRFDQLFATLSAGFTMSEKLGAFAEVYAFNKEEASGDARAYADAGVSYLLSRDFALDARIGFGLGNETDYFVGAGFSRRF